ncbi:MAG: hypothetical protein LBI05_09910, partial [Planctomycetaceae bacterium]|nr:hypothetical protein [Planctomycetaceae bacterium]
NHLLIKHAVVWSKDGLDELRKLDIPPHERILMDRLSHAQEQRALSLCARCEDTRETGMSPKKRYRQKT